ncbi:MAG: hypothetical protein ACLUDP_13970 [[Clostridium] innocuum]
MDTINPLCTKELRMKEKAKHRMMKHSIIRFYKAYGVTQPTFEEDTAGRLSDLFIEQAGSSTRLFISKAQRTSNYGIADSWRLPGSCIRRCKHE